jgi:hypothetical protein
LDFNFDFEFELLDDPDFREPLPLAFLLDDVDDDAFFFDLDD